VWDLSKADNPTLNRLIPLWVHSIGVNLKDGNWRKRCLYAMAEFMGNSVAGRYSP